MRPVNLVAMLGAWALGGLTLVAMRWGESMTARRHAAIHDGIDTIGVVTARRSAGAQHRRIVFDLTYPDQTGGQHEMKGVALTGHVDVGSHIAIRYHRDRPAEGAVAPEHVRSPRSHLIGAIALFGLLGLSIGLAL